MSVDFIELAKSQLNANQPLQALQTCLQGLSSYPNSSQGRLILARVFYEMHCIPFAVREIKELCLQFPESRHLKNLLVKLDPSINTDNLHTVNAVSSKNKSSQTNSEESVLAEADFEVELLEDSED